MREKKESFILSNLLIHDLKSKESDETVARAAETKTQGKKLKIHTKSRELTKTVKNKLHLIFNESFVAHNRRS